MDARKYIDKKEKNDKKNELDLEKKFTIYWVRHGLSCANVVFFTRKFYLDPDLSYIGYKQLMETRKKIKELKIKYDYVFCSNLSRAIQSCFVVSQDYKKTCEMFKNYIFKKEDIPCDDDLPKMPKKQINVSPFIKESGIGRDNNATTPEIFLHKYSKLINEKVIDIKTINKKEWSNNPNFYKFVNDMLKVGEIDNKNILAVSHSHAIRYFVNNFHYGKKKIKGKILNGGICKADYVYTKKNGKEKIECIDFEILFQTSDKLLKEEKQYLKHCEFTTDKNPIEFN